MITRRFGRTEIPLSVFSCGGMRYQQSWKRGTAVTPQSQANLQATVDRALALGINHIETARGYGTSEIQLGPVLARHPRDSFYLQTKLRPTDHPRDLEKQLEESFEQLQVDYLDLFAFHGVNTPTCLDRVLRPGGCMELVDRYRRDGKIRHVGFSTHGPLSIILAAIESGRFDYVNLHYYYIFQDNRPALTAARRQDMGVFIISPTDKGGRLQSPPAKLRTLCAPLTPMVFNELWCLRHPEIHTLSIGPSIPAHFDDHLKTLTHLPDADALVEAIVARLEEAYATGVGPGFAKHWQEGLRDWREMPGQVNVRRILWLRNLVKAYDLLDFAQERYAAMSVDDHWVPGGHATNLDDDALIAALPDSPFRNEIPALLREADTLLHNPHVEGLP